MGEHLNKEVAGKIVGRKPIGVLFGLTVRDPQSATLTTIVEGGYIRVKSSTQGKPFDEYPIQPASKAFTASKDTYVYVDGSTGAVAYAEVANGAAKPALTSLAANSQFLAKVVTDGSRVADGGVTDLREMAPVDLVTIEGHVSFVTAGQGATIKQFLPFRGRVLYMRSVVALALGASDTGTITAALGKNGKFTNITNGVLTLAISAAVAELDEVTPSAANVFAAGDVLQATSLKTTTGGEAQVQFICERF